MRSGSNRGGAGTTRTHTHAQRREGRRDRKCGGRGAPGLTEAVRRAGAVAGGGSAVPEPPRPAMGLLSDPVRRRALARLVLRLNAPLW